MSLIKIDETVPRFGSHRFTHPISWKITQGQHWALIGSNGAGKSQLIDILLEKQALLSGRVECKDGLKTRKIAKYVSFSDIYSLVDIGNSYYQQRWNVGIEQSAPYVKEFFTDADTTWISKLIEVFAIDDLKEKRVHMLSSGELRKTLIVLSLLSKPQLLILDNPYIGLDVRSRGVFNEMLEQLTRLDDVQIITIVSQPEDVAEIITHVLPMKDKTLLPVLTRKEFLENDMFIKELFSKQGDNKIVKLPPFTGQKPEYENVLIFRDVDIKYGECTILNKVNWTVKRGDKWLLWGENGAGKSTMMGLIAGDNPQAYARDITLFDRKRGTGESIWDIKKRIGYISPEIALYYRRNITCQDVVTSGFFDTIGSTRKCSEEQLEIALLWMRTFGIEYLRDTSMLNISIGERQLALLARVFVKSPQLLLLDEPLHGLDYQNKEYVKQIIAEYCTKDISLIYVTHYEAEIPDIITDKMVLKKQA